MNFEERPQDVISESMRLGPDRLHEENGRVDLIGSGLVGLTLFAGLVTASILAPLVRPVETQVKWIFREVGDSAVPTVTSMFASLQRFHLVELIALTLAGFGYWILRSMPDRRRANLYGGAVSLLLIALGLFVFLALFLPLMKMFAVLGNYPD